MVFFAGVTMAALGACGLLTAIVNFAGETVLNAMMAGVGLVLTKLALGMMKENKLVGITSVVTAVLVYFFLGQNLVYTIVISLVVSSAAAKLAGQDIGGGVGTAEKMGRLKLEKPIFNLSVLRGALALACLTVGANIAFGSITGGIAGASQNVDHLTIYSGLADAVSALFGGAPVEAIISATAGAPHPVTAGVLMMGIMAVILFCGLLPKICKYDRSGRYHGRDSVYRPVLRHAGGHRPQAVVRGRAGPVTGGARAVQRKELDLCLIVMS